MKKALFILFAIPFFCNAQVSGDYYGLYQGSDLSGNTLAGIATADVATSVVTLLSAFPNASRHNFAGDHAVDPINHSFFQVVGDSIDLYLCNYNIDSGTLTNVLFTVDSVGTGLSGTIAVGGNIQGTFYNCFNNMLYFCHYKAPYENYMHFAKVNPVTALVTEIDSFAVGTVPIDNSVVPDHQIAYFLENNYTTDLFDHLVAFNLSTNTKDTIYLSTPVPPSYDYWYLTYNPNDGMLYGIQSDLDSFVVNNTLEYLTFLKVDPVSGTVTYISPEFLANVTGSNMSVNPNGDHFSSNVSTTNPGSQMLATFDIASNTYQVTALTYSNFSNVQYPSLIGIDGYTLPKQCSMTSSVDDQAANCNDPISSVMKEQNPSLYLGCHWKDYAGMQLQIYDEWGRKITEQVITSPLVQLEMNEAASQIYFYSITDKGEMKTSGKTIMMH